MRITVVTKQRKGENGGKGKGRKGEEKGREGKG